MAMTSEQVAALVATLEADKNLLHQFIHGDAETVITTEGGTVPSLAKIIADYELEVEGKQPLDGDLTAIAALTTTTFGRALLTLADEAAGRTALGAASPADITAAIDVLTAMAPGVLDTFAEFAAALGDDPDFAGTMVTGLAGKADAAATTSALAAKADAAATTSALAGKQALADILTAIAALSATGLVARTGSGTVAARTLTGTSNQITVTNGDGVSGNPTLSLSSTIILPGLITAPQFRSAAPVTIADDGVLVITPAATINGGVLILVPSVSSAPAAILSLRANPSAEFCAILASTNGSSLAAGTGVLTGTTGADGKLTVSAAGGNIYVENRLGTARTYFFMLMGS
jgi:hypothetical protein